MNHFYKLNFLEVGLLSKSKRILKLCMSTAKLLATKDFNNLGSHQYLGEPIYHNLTSLLNFPNLIGKQDCYWQRCTSLLLSF